FSSALSTPFSALKMLPDLRHNRATWAVSDGLLPAVARALVVALPAEPFDPNFRGQRLETTYFDTPGFALRKARHRGKRYLTLRLRAGERRKSWWIFGGVVRTMAGRSKSTPSGGEVWTVPPLPPTN